MLKYTGKYPEQSAERLCSYLTSSLCFYRNIVALMALLNTREVIPKYVGSTVQKPK